MSIKPSWSKIRSFSHEEYVRREKYIIDKLKSGLGYSLAACCGVVGNLWRESGLDEQAGNSIGAYGIAQWYKDRKNNYIKLFKAKLEDEKSFEHQVEYLVYELKNVFVHGYYNLTYFKNLNDSIETLKEVTWNILLKFEHPGDEKSHFRARMEKSLEVYKRHGGIIPEGYSEYSIPDKKYKSEESTDYGVEKRSNYRSGSRSGKNAQTKSILSVASTGVEYQYSFVDDANNQAYQEYLKKKQEEQLSLSASNIYEENKSNSKITYTFVDDTDNDEAYRKHLEDLENEK